MSIGFRLAFSYAGLITLLLLLFAIYYPRYVYERERKQLVAALEAEAKAMAPYIKEPLQVADTPRLQSRVVEIGRRTEARVTVVLPDGVVAADSEANPNLMENHARQPEVMDALSNRIGHSLRWSGTVRGGIEYLALPLDNGGRVIGVLRLARSAQLLDKQAGQETRSLILVAFCTAIVVAGWAVFWGRQIQRSLARLEQAASQIGLGNYDTPLPPDGTDEVGRLVAALRQMAGQLKVLVGELREQQARLRETLESMPDGVIALDADGKIETINSTASQLCGLEGDGAVGKTLLEATMHYGLAAVAGAAAREGRASQELRFGLSGDIVVSATAVRRKAASGVPEVVLLLHDRTKEDRLSQVRSDFIADASHELRTPAAGMRALAETLQLSRQAGIEMSKDLVDELERQATRLGELVNDLLDLAAIEAGTRSFSKVPVEVRQLLSDLHNAYKAKLQEKNINCRLEPCELSIATDARALLQILGNILNNAIRHTPNGKTIYITAKRVGQWCEIAIRDEGEGIEPGELCRIFERFYRSQKARDRETGGTGLGLSIAKHLALALGGSIEAASTPGEGSTFVVRIPLD